MAVILAYGDSNTHGTQPMASEADEQRLDWPLRWPGVMAARLGPNHRVIEEGLPGRTVCNDDPIEGAMWNGARTLPAILNSHKTLDVMVIMLGTNDFQSRFSMTGQELAWGVERMVQGALSSGLIGSLLYVIPPRIRETGTFAEAFTGAEAREAGLAGHLARILAPHTGQGLRIFDANSIIAVDPLDGVHFGKAAHAALGAAIAQEVGAMIEGNA